MATPSIPRAQPAQARPRPRHPILQTLHGEPFMRISRSLIEVCCDSLDGAAMVAQAISWSMTLAESRGGWFYKSIPEWQEETSVTRDRQKRIRQRLRQRTPRFWFEQKRGCPPTNWFRLDLDVLESEIGAAMEARRCQTERKSMGGKPAVSMGWKPAHQRAGAPSDIERGNSQTNDGKAANHSQENTHRGTQGPLARSSQDTESAPAAKNAERKFYRELKRTANNMTAPSVPWPKDPLRLEFRRGIYPDKVENVFFDSRMLKFPQQLRDCAKNATAQLVNNRPGKMMHVNAQEIENTAFERLKAAAEALERMANFDTRRRHVARATIMCVVEAAAASFEKKFPPARVEPGTRAGRAEKPQGDLFWRGT